MVQLAIATKTIPDYWLTVDERILATAIAELEEQNDRLEKASKKHGRK